VVAVSGVGVEHPYLDTPIAMSFYCIGACIDAAGIVDGETGKLGDRDQLAVHIVFKVAGLLIERRGRFVGNPAGRDDAAVRPHRLGGFFGHRSCPTEEACT